jgi:DNA-binding protein H-NS
MGIEVSQDMERKRSYYKRVNEFIEYCDSNNLSGGSDVPEEFQPYLDEVARYAEFLKFSIAEKEILRNYSELFKILSVDESEIAEMIAEVSEEINAVIYEFEQKLVDEVEVASVEEDQAESDEDLVMEEKVEQIDENSEGEVWTDQELYKEYVDLEFEGAGKNLRIFLNNPEYTHSLLRVFGTFKYSVEKDFNDLEARNYVVKIFLDKVLTYGESNDWSTLARRSCREAIIESFVGYEMATGSTIDLLNKLNFESELEAEYVYHPSAIRCINNVPIDFRKWRELVRFMGGEINTNQGSKHPEYVIPFDEFNWKYSIPTSFFLCKHSRYARIFMNELTEFMSRQGIESLTKDDFERLQAAYDSIDIRIEFRP